MSNKIPVFLGGPSREHTRVRQYASRLERSGLVQLTSRWHDTCHEWSGKDALLTVEQQDALTSEHMRAIRKARIAWFLWPISEERSMVECELGAALIHRWHGGGKARLFVVVTGTRASRCMATGHANYREASDELGLDTVLRVARELMALAALSEAAE